MSIHHKKPEKSQKWDLFPCEKRTHVLKVADHHNLRNGCCVRVPCTSDRSFRSNSSSIQDEKHATHRRIRYSKGPSLAISRCSSQIHTISLLRSDQSISLSFFCVSSNHQSSSFAHPPIQIPTPLAIGTATCTHSGVQVGLPIAQAPAGSASTCCEELGIFPRLCPPRKFLSISSHPKSCDIWNPVLPVL